MAEILGSKVEIPVNTLEEERVLWEASDSSQTELATFSFDCNFVGNVIKIEWKSDTAASMTLFSIFDYRILTYHFPFYSYPLYFGASDYIRSIECDKGQLTKSFTVSDCKQVSTGETDNTKIIPIKISSMTFSHKSK